MFEIYLGPHGNNPYNPVTSRCYFPITAKNIRKPKVFLMFSSGKDKQLRTVMG